MLEPDLEMISSESNDVRAGMQGNVRLLIYHSASVFLTPYGKRKVIQSTS